MAEAKSSSHVPKFGNWDSEDVQYTICFENARELHAAGVTFDPNDPDTYPSVAVVNQKAIPADRRHDDSQDYHQRRGMANSGSEKLSSERSSSDYALLKEAKHRGRKKKNSNNEAEGMSIFPATTVDGHSGNPNRNPIVRRNKEGEMMTSVPKFGSWDVRDPKSGDGYTAIFNKVKVEKQIGGSNNPQAVPPLMNQTKQTIAQTTTANHKSTSFASKICCCLCSK